MDRDTSFVEPLEVWQQIRNCHPSDALASFAFAAVAASVVAVGPSSTSIIAEPSFVAFAFSSTASAGFGRFDRPLKFEFLLVKNNKI